MMLRGEGVPVALLFEPTGAKRRLSVEEWTEPGCWWCENPEVDPWIWREIIAGKRKIAYGKFFDKKAGYISLEWLPYFVNARRDGYDFDARWEHMDVFV